jgi:glycerol-3-phosphate O-acyltransferase
VSPAREELVYQVPDDARLRIDTYKNMVLHAFAPEAIVANAILGETEPALHAVRARAQALSRVLKLEFVFRTEATFGSLFDEALASLVSRGLVAISGEAVVVGESGRATLVLTAGLIRATIESYVVAAKALPDLLAGPLPAKEVIHRTLTLAQRLYFGGELERFEACNKLVFSNALSYFRDRGVLVPTDEDRSTSPVMLAAPNRDAAVLERVVAEIADLLPRV